MLETHVQPIAMPYCCRHMIYIKCQILKQLFSGFSRGSFHFSLLGKRNFPLFHSSVVKSGQMHTGEKVGRSAEECLDEKWRRMRSAVSMI